ncbi:MAG: C40 family peptidase [Bacteroidota bacterium]
MDYAVVAVPAAPIRRKPSHRREMLNQLLFGETVKVLKEKNCLWVKVRSLHDGYEGWTTNTLLQEVKENFATARSAFVTTEMLSTIILGEKKINIPAGSSLPFLKDSKGLLGETEFSFKGNYFKRDEQVASAELITNLTASWLNAPYLWGGRTPLGVDCSGFVQVIYKLMGIDLPRDAWQQAQEGKTVKKFSEALPGDLAFFNDKEEIVHVGILLRDEQIIHASGKVRIDRMDKKGIINAETGKRAMKLQAVRRIWQ